MPIAGDASDASNGKALRRTAEIVSSYLSSHRIQPIAIPELIRLVYETVDKLGSEPRPSIPVRPERPKPAVPISRSVQHDFIVCLEDGNKLTMLKRYLMSRYGLSPDDYRRRWGLAPDYPMVAPAYAARRSAFAKDIGLGKGVRRKR
jgi:predicted transcriptional regulator